MPLSEGEATRAFLAARTGEAFSALAQHLIPRLLRYFEVRGCDPDWAEDLTQEVLLAAYLHVDGVRHPEAFGAWIYRIARNTLLQALRRRSREVDTVALDTVCAERSAGLDWTQGSAFAEWIACLGAEDREVMLLRFVDGMNYGEIAAVLGIPAGTARWKVFHAKARIVARLGRSPKPVLCPAFRE